MNSIIITGANSGIGYECTLQMAKIAPNHQIILACRNVQAGNKAIKNKGANKSFKPDLSSFGFSFVPIHQWFYNCVFPIAGSMYCSVNQ